MQTPWKSMTSQQAGAKSWRQRVPTRFLFFRASQASNSKSGFFLVLQKTNLLIQLNLIFSSVPL